MNISLKLKSKLLISLILLSIFVFSTVILTTYFLVKDKLYTNIEISSIKSAESYARQISDMFEIRKTELAVYSTMPLIQSLDWDKIEPFLKKEFEKKKDFYDILFVADSKGDYNTVLKRNAGNLQDRAYWKPVMEGNTVISEPVISKSTGNLVSVISVPIKDDNGKVIGVIAGNLKMSNFYEKIKNNTVSHKDSYCYVINKSGKFLAYSDKEYILTESIAAKSKNIPDTFVAASKDILSLEKGSVQFEYKKSDQYVFFSAIPNLNGWKFCLSVPVNYISQPVNEVLLILQIISIIFIVIISIAAIIIGNMIAHPITAVTDFIHNMASGNFTGNIKKSYMERKDEIGILSRAAIKLKESMTEIINKISDNAKNLIESSDTLSYTAEEMSRELESINKSVNEISFGITNTSATTQEVSASTQEVNDSVQYISQRALESCNNANVIKEKAFLVQNDANNSFIEVDKTYKEKADNIIKAIEKGKVFDEVRIMVDTITGIAEQTNLLALNAAIEAARAGEQGKGFAIVSDEIRKLATESSIAASNVKSTIKSVQEAYTSLSQESNNILEFMQNSIKDKFIKFKDAGEQYYADSEQITIFSNDLATMTKNITNTLKMVNEAIQNVAENSSKGTEDASSIVDSVSQSVNDMEKVYTVIKKQVELSNSLNELIKKFII
ncbi:methyl-accepting chemotaxis protein [Pseudobacteroides cellulosolvens]|uniref:Methyl-accepting chemotaxis sensory transducer with Cache sensor n=1 Tax=Pseudobacteroides cellulosolvens ATCC 35603 = DSM 2933 TaxID=398512 RepID=A0A0L6JVB8_9FIRM|nr:methyl-accepting chemotaxis protein [Pseudobacteroides cellulosolvens]KNY29674.1 methyl-accepting chemotaxis sensory transducer with Cache sensor [Pseudobacteroides cellulosolvens ATCC 35603 = DSM 2933]